MQLLRFFQQPLRFSVVARALVDPHRLAGTGVGAQVLAQALLVVADQPVGSVQDVAERPVVLFELDDAADAVLAFEVGHVADAGAAKGIDALVVVADGEHALAAGRSRRPRRRREHLQPGVLQPVGVLEFIDQHMREALLVVLAQRLVVAHQLVAAQHQLGEVDHAFALALLFIDPVDVDHATRLLVADLDVAGALAFFLLVGDEPADLLGDETVFVQVQSLDDALDGAQLVTAVEDLENPAAGPRASSAPAGIGCTARGRCRSTCPGRPPAASPTDASASPWRPCW